MTIRIIAVGTLKESFYESAVAEYVKRLGKYAKVEIIQIKESTPEREATDIATKIKGYTILLDINGVPTTSPALAKLIQDTMMTKSTITFLIGGSNGVGSNLDNLVENKISFGAITLPHQLFRVVLVEQIYRAFTIIGNEKYHK
ncbi:MAG: 23S rRNA (pseudouridine(1915)-N(3))-methyltransferase RlmH [Firmicutes bacterium]|nr:23S rRNA (pseudouridine(1915)-N(3))-methyltransferase RlmH [Bacillota bacterium]